MKAREGLVEIHSKMQDEQTCPSCRLRSLNMGSERVGNEVITVKEASRLASNYL